MKNIISMNMLVINVSVRLRIQLMCNEIINQNLQI